MAKRSNEDPVVAMTFAERELLLFASDAALLAKCEVDRYRASGPGGQHRNKTDSAVRLRMLSLKLTAIAEESRSQHDNKDTAVKRMRAQVACKVRVEVVTHGYEASSRLREMLTAGTKPLGEKTKVKPEFWAPMAELLDVFFASKAQVATAAQLLGISSGALSKMLLHEDTVAKSVNEMRQQFGLRPLV
jgi:RF-1 domain